MPVVEGIDPIWLAEALRRDPVQHSFAAWDVRNEPDRIRLVSWTKNGTTAGYLLIWLADPAHPFVHWFGGTDSIAELGPKLPPRPLTLVVPEEVAPFAAEARAPVTSERILRLTARPSAPLAGSDDPRVRELGPRDLTTLRAWAEPHSDQMARGYARFDPARHVAWGAFDGARIVGAAFASVRLPEIWSFNGIYVEPGSRGHGLGAALSARAVEAARRAGAIAHLNVRESNAAARRVYAHLGFREHDRLLWMESTFPAPNR
ncbi:MAG: GNAT family N-acetyltransferase [Thermoplasmata archaeon]